MPAGWLGKPRLLLRSLGRSGRLVDCCGLALGTGHTHTHEAHDTCGSVAVSARFAIQENLIIIN